MCVAVGYAMNSERMHFCWCQRMNHLHLRQRVVYSYQPQEMSADIASSCVVV